MQNSEFDRMDFRCLFSQGLVIGTKELDRTSKANQFCLIVECPLMPLLWSIQSVCLFLFPCRFSLFLLFDHLISAGPFFGLHTSICLDLVNLELFCGVLFPHQTVVQRCIMGYLCCAIQAGLGFGIVFRSSIFLRLFDLHIM